MKKFLKLFPIFSLIFLFINPIEVKAIDNFEINDLKVNIMVNEDGTYDITEDYKLNFTSPGLGIYRDLISIVDMDWQFDDERVSKTYNFPISDISVSGDEFYVEEQLNGKRIVIGPDDGPRFTGEKDYTVKYTVLSKPIDVKDQQEAFFYNLVSDWSAIMHNFSATVQFYDEVDLDKLQVVGTDYMGNFDVDCNINSSTSFTCNYNQDVRFNQGNGITALVPLEADYFNRASDTYIYITSFLAMALALVLGLSLWTRHGKDDPIVEVVGFKPPQGFNSAMVGYVFDDTVDNNDLYSLLFYWANQGLIRINEKKKEKLEFIKLKDISDNVPLFEKTLFNKMFYQDEAVTTTDWQKKNIFSEMEKAKPKVKLAVEKNGSLYDSTSSKFKALVAIISLIPISLYLLLKIFFETKSMFAVAVTVAIAIVYFLISFLFYSESIKQIQRSKAKIFSASITYVAITALIAFIASMLTNSILGANINWIILLSMAVLSSISFMIASFMKKRSQYGSKIYGEILGLKTFIKYAKKDELLAMQEENPYLYYDVLPYAYAFGISALWNKQFKEIEIPQSQYYTTYRSGVYTNYILMNSMLRSVNTAPSQVMPKVQSGSGGASFGGGGFSGGGSFSGGGGFGGGGGGGR